MPIKTEPEDPANIDWKKLPKVNPHPEMDIPLHECEGFALPPCELDREDAPTGKDVKPTLRGILAASLPKHGANIKATEFTTRSGQRGFRYGDESIHMVAVVLDEVKPWQRYNIQDPQKADPRETKNFTQEKYDKWLVMARGMRKKVERKHKEDEIEMFKQEAACTSDRQKAVMMEVFIDAPCWLKTS